MSTNVCAVPDGAAIVSLFNLLTRSPFTVGLKASMEAQEMNRHKKYNFIFQFVYSFSFPAATNYCEFRYSHVQHQHKIPIL